MKSTLEFHVPGDKMLVPVTSRMTRLLKTAYRKAVRLMARLNGVSPFCDYGMYYSIDPVRYRLERTGKRGRTCLTIFVRSDGSVNLSAYYEGSIYFTILSVQDLHEIEHACDRRCS